MSAFHLRLAALALIATAAAACSPDRAVSDNPVGDPAYGIQMLLTPSNLPRGQARFPAPDTSDAPPTITADDTISVTVAGLDSLEGATYAVWLADEDGLSITKATGTLIVVRTDTVLDQFGDPVAAPDTNVITNVSAFSNGGPRHQMTLVTSRAASGLTATDPVDVVFLSIESDPNASSPSETRRPLWGRNTGGTLVRTRHIDTVTTLPVLVTDTTFDRRFRRTNVIFGNFAFDPADQYVFVPAGRGRAFFRGDVIVINDSSLSRPPLGYYYAAYVVKSDDVTNLPVDTVYLGPVTAPFPNREISLRDADSVLLAPEVQVLVVPPNLAGSWANPSPSAILAASSRASADTVAALMGATGPFRGLTDVFITLESKHAPEGRLGPAILLRAGIPEIVRFGND